MRNVNIWLSKQYRIYLASTVILISLKIRVKKNNKTIKVDFEANKSV